MATDANWGARHDIVIPQTCHSARCSELLEAWERFVWALSLALLIAVGCEVELVTNTLLVVKESRLKKTKQNKTKG